MAEMSESAVEQQISREEERGHDTLEEKLVRVNRVAKVIKGGRLFGFSALTVVGDGKGRVGFGVGKAREVPVAIQKAMEKAKRNMIKVELHGDTLCYPLKARHGASIVYMQPASPGTGIIAGGAMRALFELVGVRDVLAKCYGSTNPLNVVRATFKGLASMESAAQVAARRGKDVKDVLPLKRERKASKAAPAAQPAKPAPAGKAEAKAEVKAGKSAKEAKAAKPAAAKPAAKPAKEAKAAKPAVKEAKAAKSGAKAEAKTPDIKPAAKDDGAKDDGKEAGE